LTVRPGAPKIVIFITDGGIDYGDTGPAARAAAQQLKDAGVIIYTIGIANSATSNSTLLTQIATENGGKGQYYPVSDTAGLQVILDSIATTLSCP
jgi:hypothetical protein